MRTFDIFPPRHFADSRGAGGGLPECLTLKKLEINLFTMHNGVDKLEVFCRVSPEDGTPSPGWCCSFSPCGGYIAIGQANGRIAIWDNLTRGVARNVNISLASQTTSSSNEKQHVQEHSDAVRSGRKRPRLAPDYLETPVHKGQKFPQQLCNRVDATLEEVHEKRERERRGVAQRK